MAHRSIEETFQTITPRGRRGIPDGPAIGVSVTGTGNDLSSSLSQAGQQIAQLQASYAQQAALIAANTEAILSNTSAQNGHSVADTAGKVASGLFGGTFGLLSPLISGIAGLFSGNSAPAPLPVYTPPAPVAVDATLRSAVPGAQTANLSTPAGSLAGGSTQKSAVSNVVVEAPGSQPPANRSASVPAQAAAVSQITINVNAMDSQSFMDRSADIASAVREAMLNLHPINDVVANL
jgi:hypothetical protein